jgi:hypothetical protein
MKRKNKPVIKARVSEEQFLHVRKCAQEASMSTERYIRVKLGLEDFVVLNGQDLDPKMVSALNALITYLKCK